MNASYKLVFEIFEKNYVKIPLEVFEDPYQILVSTLMSSRTKDEVTLEASIRLFAKAPTVQKLDQLSQTEIQELIYPVGFYKTKAEHLKILSKKLINEFESQVPETRQELTSLPGVGRKTANLVLNRAFGIPVIAVDTHVHRITNLLGWVSTKSPRETEDKLYAIIEQKYWSKINRLFVSIGRQYGTGKKLVQFLKENNLIY